MCFSDLSLLKVSVCVLMGSLWLTVVMYMLSSVPGDKTSE